MEKVRGAFANIETGFPNVLADRRTKFRSQNIYLETARLSEVELAAAKKRLIWSSRRLRIMRYLRQTVALFSVAAIAIITFHLSMSYTSFDPFAVSGVLAAIAAGLFSLLLVHTRNKRSIEKCKRELSRLAAPEEQQVTISEYWFGSQPVQFLFDDTHFMIAGENAEYYGYIPLNRIVDIEVSTDERFVGRHGTPALWITIAGQIEVWSESNILIAGHFFEDRNLDAADTHNKMATFTRLLQQSCPNLRR